MAFKIVLSDPKTRKAYQKEVEEAASGLIGKKIGDKVSADFLGLSGYEVEITGGSDKDGFPMRKDVDGVGRKRILLSGGVGFHSKIKGQRKRKSIRGNTISAQISQINMKIVKHGAKKIEDVLGKTEKKEVKELTEEEKQKLKQQEAAKLVEKVEAAAPVEKAKKEAKEKTKEKPAEEKKEEPKTEEKKEEKK